MTCCTSEEAQDKVCWVCLEAMGEPYCCWGEDCTAWQAVPYDKADGDDITPKGVCSLLMARLTAASEE